MNFGYEQGNEEIMIYFNDSEEAINDLVCDGYLDESIREMDDESVEYVQTVSQAVIDKLLQTAEDEETDFPELFEEHNDVIRASMVMDMNMFFNRFLSYREL